MKIGPQGSLQKVALRLKRLVTLLCSVANFLIMIFRKWDMGTHQSPVMMVSIGFLMLNGVTNRVMNIMKH